MSSQPPPLPATKNLRLAAALNMFLPGAGLFYLGRRVAGSILAIVFLGFFVTLLVIFLAGAVVSSELAHCPGDWGRDCLSRVIDPLHSGEATIERLDAEASRTLLLPLVQRCFGQHNRGLAAGAHFG
jgi:hypothetical protein